MTACVITWVCCAFTALLSILLLAVLAVDADALFAEMQRQNPDLADQGVSDATLQSATWATGIVCLVWALVSGGLAVLAFQRMRWASVALVVSAGVVALFVSGFRWFSHHRSSSRDAGGGDGRPAAAAVGAALAGPS